jgi:cyclophilin family peptidyl-prolyl cis-trans isomerase
MGWVIGMILTGLLATALPASAAKGGLWNPVNWFQESPVTTQPASEPAKPKETPAPADKSIRYLPSPSQQEASQSSPARAVRQERNGAVISTQRGDVVIQLFPTDAPQTVANFRKLVESGFYSSGRMTFHRVVPGFVVQTGDPTGTGYGGSRDRVKLEVRNKLSHNAKGIVAMARSADPDSATSQFYITLKPQPTLDGKYAIFGKVIQGLDVLDKIEKGDRLYSVELRDVSDILAQQESQGHVFFSAPAWMPLIGKKETPRQP